MPALRLFLGALLGAALAVPAARAQYGKYCGCYYPPIPQAPDACGPGFYSTNCCGLVYGPGYCLRPCFPPFQGMLPGPPPKCGPGAAGGYAGPGMLNSPVFPTHPYARSPRDYFMYYDRGGRDYFMY